MRKIGVLSIGQTANADEAASAMLELNLMLKQWVQEGPFLWVKREASQTLAANDADYNLSTTFPVRIIEARYRDTSSPAHDVPMQPLTRDEYFELPVKTATGVPTTYYFDAQATNNSSYGVLYIWPLLASATTESVRYTYQRRIEDIDDLGNTIDIPQEWLATVGYCLADRLLDDYGVSDKVGDRITARAQEMLQRAKDFEREETIFFRPGYYR